MSIRSIVPLVGDVIAGRYEITGLLGQGGMGIVYAARDSTLSRAVALKVLRPQTAARYPDAARRFTREAKVAAALDHPNAVRIFDFGADGDRSYLAMELLAGETLADLLAREGVQSLDHTVSVLYPVADVLAEAHRLGMVHRDIKPANIFISAASDRVVVLDFGMAFLTEPGDDLRGRITEDSLSGGTPVYMSPEQCADGEIGPASDIYSLGCVLFEMLCGRLPFEERSRAKLLTSHLYVTAPRLRDLQPELPRALDELLARMLAKPLGRRPTAEAVRKRLASVGAGALGERERSRDASYLSSREARALPRPTPAPLAAAGPESFSALIVADVPGDLEIGLAAVGISARFGESELAGDHDVVYLRSSDLETISRVVGASTVPVVVGAPSLAVRELHALLRLGVTDVVSRPESVAEVADKLRRALVRARRSDR